MAITYIITSITDNFDRDKEKFLLSFSFLVLISLTSLCYNLKNVSQSIGTSTVDAYISQTNYTLIIFDDTTSWTLLPQHNGQTLAHFPRNPVGIWQPVWEKVLAKG